jgi:hypothetical protein
VLNCFDISRSLSSEEDDPIQQHLIPENRDFEPKVRKGELDAAIIRSRNKRAAHSILLIATADVGRTIEQHASRDCRIQ